MKNNLCGLCFAVIATVAVTLLGGINAQAQVPLQVDFSVNTPYDAPFGPFGTNQTIVITALLRNISTTQTITVCGGVCTGDANTYSLGGYMQLPCQFVPPGSYYCPYDFYFGDDASAPAPGSFFNETDGPLAPGETREFTYGVLTPPSPIPAGSYPFTASVQVFAATSERPMLSWPSWGTRNLVITTLPVYSCEGFQSPFDVQLTLGANKNQSIPLKAQLFDANTDALAGSDTVNVAPIAVVRYVAGPAAAPEDSSPSSAAKTNATATFRFNRKSGDWSLNLSTRADSTPGTYAVIMEPGNSQYFVSPPCVGSFIRE